MRYFFALHIIIYLNLILIYSYYYLNRKLKNLAMENEREAESYSKNIVIGISAGLIVIVLDRVVTQLFKLELSLNFNSIGELIISSFHLILIILLISFFLGVSVKYITYKGFKKSIQN